MLNCLITGGTDGIGRAAALDALAAGHRVVVVGGTAAKARRSCGPRATPPTGPCSSGPTCG